MRMINGYLLYLIAVHIYVLNDSTLVWCKPDITVRSTLGYNVALLKSGKVDRVKMGSPERLRILATAAVVELLLGPITPAFKNHYAKTKISNVKNSLSSGSAFMKLT